MKRFVLYALLVPVVGTLVTMAFQAMFGGLSLTLLPRTLDLIQWFIPALVIATADRFIPSRGWPRLGTISVVGYIATLMTISLLWRLSWQDLPLLLLGAMTAFLCCWLLERSHLPGP